MSQVEPKPGDTVYDVVPYLVPLHQRIYDAERWLSYRAISVTKPQAFRVYDELHRKPTTPEGK